MAIIAISISQGIDDVARKLTASYWSRTAVGYPVGANSVTAYQQGVGLRFQNITVPQGAIINSAKLTIESGGDTDGLPKTRISAEKADNAVEIADDSAAFDTRWTNRTTARVDWDDGSIPLGVPTDSPDIKSVIQEVVSRASWSSGNAILIFWDDFEDRSAHGANRYHVAFYENVSYNQPKLTIDYTPGVKITDKSANMGSKMVAIGAI